MKKFLTLAAAAGMALGAANAAPAKTLKLNGNQLSYEDNSPAQLRGFSTFSIHFADGTACLSDMHFEAMKNWGCNVCRLAVYVDDRNDGGAYIKNPSKFKGAVKGYMDQLMAQDMYVVVDWHILETSDNDRGNAGDPNTYASEAKEFFKEIAQYVVDKKYQGKVLYELCNEPSMGVNFSTIKKYAEPLMDEIIKIDNQALCIVGTEGWCQKILEASKNPLDNRFAKHALYSFHYYACSHEYLIGDFSNAAANVPVIVSEWSTVNFTGDGQHCGSASDKLMSVCGYRDEANPENDKVGQNSGDQYISWFFWNWGKKNEGSTVFAGDCGNPQSNKKSVPGEYILKVLGGGQIKDLPVSPDWPKLNPIPSSPTAPFDWMNYNLGGEGVAYHDGDGAAYDKNTKTGYYTAYTSGADESDALSEARNRETSKTDKLGMNKNYTYGKGNNALPTAWSSADETCWGDMDWTSGVCGSKGHTSLNAGLGYSKDLSFFPDEALHIAGADEAVEVEHGRAFSGVDVSKCSGKIKGTGSINAEIATYTHGNICSIEPGEWVSYKVNVTTPGYYKVHYMASGQNSKGTLGISLNGKGGGNIVRDFKQKDDINALADLGTKPGEGLGESDYENWIWQQLIDNEDNNKDVGVVFLNEGKQSITITFNEENGNTGPLYFELVDDNVEPEREAQANRQTELDNASASQLVIAPNPTSGEFTVSLGSAEAAQVSVVNIAGQTVYSQAVEGQDEVTISKKLASGVYTVVVATEAGVRTAKLQVK